MLACCGVCVCRVYIRFMFIVDVVNMTVQAVLVTICWSNCGGHVGVSHCAVYVDPVTA